MPMPDLAKTKMCYNYFRRRLGPTQIAGGFEPHVCHGASQGICFGAHFRLENLPGDAMIPSASSRMALGSSDLFGPIPFGRWRLVEAKLGKLADQGSTIGWILSEGLNHQTFCYVASLFTARDLSILRVNNA